MLYIGSNPLLIFTTRTEPPLTCSLSPHFSVHLYTDHTCIHDGEVHHVCVVRRECIVSFLFTMRMTVSDFVFECEQDERRVWEEYWRCVNGGRVGKRLEYLKNVVVAKD
ncbi:hypothetical protein VCUG_02353 [Vavraia culicis subsp. floridensis]|uniref:Uncharacterized protein n=1 Tax=Vavraia culicis (isolate floridensis) TaxID=948595 RepID=L2GR65_VAVCU|nr:uncharacterized protein VCUG_02353 [Vavraia culicis subsp. floridensis]ELA46151.1 hypothetical protein VCUG_02353 [Vavraia culicis subsp. floridensis]